MERSIYSPFSLNNSGYSFLKASFAFSSVSKHSHSNIPHSQQPSGASFHLKGVLQGKHVTTKHLFITVTIKRFSCAIESISAAPKMLCNFVNN